MATIHELADYAAVREILIGIEIHGIITGNGEKAVPVIEKIGRPNVRINYDTANCEFWGGVEAVTDLPKCVDLCAFCHLKDTVGGYRVWNFPAIGSGHVDFRKVLDIFAAHHYTGPFSVEIEFQGEPWPPLADVNAAMKQSYQTLAALGLS
jgi:sugar phosphate isomerase/epimerase